MMQGLLISVNIANLILSEYSRGLLKDALQLATCCLFNLIIDIKTMKDPYQKGIVIVSNILTIDKSVV